MWQLRAASACIVKSKVWEGRQVLRVFFMNPEVLRGWKYRGREITTEMIMEWASVWEQASSAPQFTVTPRVGKADIRVKFSGNNNLDLLHISRVILPTQPKANAGLWWVCRQLPLLKISQQ